MSAEAVAFIAILFYCTVITMVLIEVQRTLRLIRLGIEKNGVLLTAANERFEGLAAKLDSVNGNIFDISERFDAPGIAKRKTDKRAQGIKALLDRLELDAGQHASRLIQSD